MTKKKPVTPALIKELRDRTGVSMSKCKEALEQAEGDIELAIANLRKAGIASAVKKEGRATNEGMIAAASTPKSIGIVEVNAETDFVVKNDKFQKFLQALAEEVAATNPQNLESFKQQKYSKDPSHTVEEYRTMLVQQIGENIQIRRIKIVPKANNKSIGVYSHLGGKILCIVEISGSNTEEGLARDIAMHIAAAAPDYITEKDVPNNVIEHEKDIAKNQIKGKPENVMNKIVEGKLNAYYDSACLVRQKYIRDDSLTINDLVTQKAKQTGKPLSVVSFTRWVVGQ